VARWFVKRRGLMTGATVAGTSVGTLVAPLIANRLISAYGWRDSFTLIGISVFIVIVGLAQLLVRDPGRKGLMPYGADRAAAGESNLDLAGLSLGEAVGKPQFWMLFAIYLFSGFVIQVIIVHIVVHAAELGIPAGRSAVVLAMVGVGSLVGRLTGGGVSDRIGNRPTTAAALTLMAAGFIWLLVARDLWMLLVFSILFGLAYGEILCMISLLPAELFGLKNQGVILGMIIFASTIGGSLGPVVAGRIFDLTGSYQTAFRICVVISVLSAMMAVLMKPLDHRRAPLPDGIPEKG